MENAPALWLIWVTFLGVPLQGAPAFTNESGCYLYLRTTHSQEAIDAFGLMCARDISPLILCPGGKCQ